MTICAVCTNEFVLHFSRERLASKGESIILPVIRKKKVFFRLFVFTVSSLNGTLSSVTLDNATGPRISLQGEFGEQEATSLQICRPLSPLFNSQQHCFLHLDN